MNSADRDMPLNRTIKPLTAQRDAQLMSAVRAGSPDAFAEIQRLYSGHLYSTIVAITRNREDAEDALQDTFLRAYRALPNFEGRSSFYSWLTRIAINSALMLLRKHRARPEVPFDLPYDIGDEIPQIEIRDLAPNPEQICDQRQRRAGMLRAIQKLEPRLRGALQIRMAQGSSLKEIARVLDISEAAVKARLYRARVRLAAAGAFRNAGAKQHVSSDSQRVGAAPGLRNREQQCMSAQRSKQAGTARKFKGNYVPGAVVVGCKGGHDDGDLRIALRQLRKSPGFTVTAILTLALGIGANAVVFSVLNALVLRPVNVPHAQNLYMVQRFQYPSQSYPDYLDLRDRNRTFESMVMFDIMGPVGVDTGGNPSTAWPYLASGNYFDALGIQPYLGRFFHAADEHGANSAPYVVLSYAYWHGHFHGDAGVVGRAVGINKHPFTIIGVAPPAFRGTELFFAPAMWIPMVEQPTVEGYDALQYRGNHSAFVVGRLKPGVTRGAGDGGPECARRHGCRRPIRQTTRA